MAADVEPQDAFNHSADWNITDYHPATSALTFWEHNVKVEAGFGVYEEEKGG